MKISLFSRRRGHQTSFEEMLAPHVEHLYHLAYRFSRSQHDAEDLVQELLVKLYSRHNELSKVKSLKPWLTRSLYNLYIDLYRRKERSPIDHGYDETISASACTDAGPQQEVQRSEMQHAIAKQMDTLNENQRILLIMHDIESYTLAEIAVILDTPIGTLKSRLHRSRAKLKKSLDDGTFSLNSAC
ncbi:MAG: RNA polymerase sigma factor [Candidatus Polarisedimenticolaceae bacterium]|nr:RNA polymerase sigma factor [Candidatus Polarisedimenticolaceae bacterium]